jgi:hypothetical protein
VLRVQETERVRVETSPLELGQLVLDPPVVGVEQGDVRRPARRVADRVEQDLGVGQPGVAIEAQAELDKLGIDAARGPRWPPRPLPELAIAAGLRTSSGTSDRRATT